MSTPSAKKKSIQRSELWQKIAENLNSVKDPCFIVEKRLVRDHIAILIQRFKRQQAQELRERGMSHQHTELDAAIEQIIVIEESCDTEQQEMNDENGGKMEADRKKAEDMHQKALETMRKHTRNSEEGSTCTRAKKSRKNGPGALEYLKERAQEDQALNQELELKKQENERLQNIQTQQIQMFKVMFDQQQQVQKQEKDDVKNFLNLARSATAPTEASSGYAEFVVDATANSNSGYDGFIRETCP